MKCYCVLLLECNFLSYHYIFQQLDIRKCYLSNCAIIEYLNLHLMGSWTVLLDPVPSELTASHWYKPLSCRLTFCKTRLWLVMITPSSRLYFNSLPFLVQTIVCGVGLECIRHSKYTSSPSLMLDAFKLRPKRSSA